MIDDFNSEESRQKLREDFNVYCKDMNLSETISTAVAQLLEAQFLKLKLGYELLISGSLEGIFTTAQQIGGNNTEIFSLLTDEFKKFSFCSLVEKLDLVEMKAKLEAELGGTLEDKLAEAKSILDDLEQSIENLDGSDDLDLEDFENELDNIVSNNENNLKAIDEKVVNYFISLMVELSKNDKDELGYSISEELEAELRGITLLDMNFDFSEYFTLVIEKIFIALSKDVKEKQSDYLIEYLGAVESNKTLMLNYTDVDGFMEYIAGVIPDIIKELDSSAAKAKKYFANGNMTFNDFIISFRYLNVELRNLVDLVNSNFVLMAFRLFDLKLEEIEFNLNYSITQFEIDYAHEKGYEDEELTIYKGTLFDGESKSGAVARGNIFCSMSFLGEDNTAPYRYYAVFKPHKFRIFRDYYEYELKVRNTAVELLRIAMVQNEDLRLDYRTKLYNELVKPTLKIGEKNLEFIQNYFVENMLESVSEIPIYKEGQKLFCHKTLSKEYSIASSYKDIYDDGERVILDNESYEYTNMTCSYLYKNKYGVFPSSSNRISSHEGRLSAHVKLWQNYSLEEAEERPFNIETLEDKSITYAFNFKDIFYKYYVSDEFVSVENFIDENKTHYFNQLDFMDSLKNLWGDGVKEFTEVRDEIIDFTDEIEEDLSELVEEGYEWLRVLLQYKNKK